MSASATAELALALFIWSRAQTRVVQVQITGSIIGTTRLFPVVIGIPLPAVFDLTERTPHPGRTSL
jgi:hypothetical protein